MTWKPGQVETVKRLHALGVPYKDIGVAVSRTEQSVQRLVSRLGLPPRNRPSVYKWPKKQDDILRESWGRMPVPEIADTLGVSPGLVRQRAAIIGLGMSSYTWHEAKKQRQTVRPCMNCRRPFKSEGAGNRLCYDCKREPLSPYAI